ncbi:MAG: hypothetical protein HKN45_00735 [Flavobacteriales bacterium]|nr:hypothetical protein [Flavobacteriales bacterium]
MTSENSVRIAELQSEIEDYISLGSNSILYNFKEEGKLLTLHAITVNPRHNQSFLFHSTQGVSRVECLEKLLDYVQNYKDKESSYTIQWSAKGDDRLQTSYFSARNVIGALDKLFFDRDPNTITIFNVSLNPIT